jgi:hypothetical protein
MYIHANDFLTKLVIIMVPLEVTPIHVQNKLDG